MDKYMDWGRDKINPNLTHTNWINDLNVYPKTPVYRNQYKHFKRHADIYEIPVKSYLSIGTGLGRHVVIAKEVFTDIQKVTTIDKDIKPHRSLQSLDLSLNTIINDLDTALSELVSLKKKFDFIVFENLGHDHTVTDSESIEKLKKIQNPSSLLALIGDTKFDTELLISCDSYLRIPNESESWGDTTKYNFWLYRD